MKLALLALSLAACNGTVKRPTAMISPSSVQLVTAIVDDWTSTQATLRLWTRDAAGTWKSVGDPWPGVIGKTGSAWGTGLHGAGPPAGRDGPRKLEGDGKSPAGVFLLRGAYGYAPAPPPNTALPYTALDARWECVDDPASAYYAQIVDHDQVKPDWHSSEQMRRPDELYTWVVDVAHNAEHTPRAGSCIFLHVWRGPDSSTVGCTAMAEPMLAHLISVLDPHATPLFVLLPASEYRALAMSWGLPAQ